MNATAQKHLDAIRSGNVTQTNVIGIRKAYNAFEKAERWGGSWARKSGLWTFDDMDTVQSAIYKCRPRIALDDPLHAGGLAILRSKRYAKRLAGVASSIAAADHFRLVDFEEFKPCHFVPVYALWSKIPPKGDALDGGTYEAFRFRVVSWQSGGDGPEILEA